MSFDYGYSAGLFGLSCSNEMRNSIIRQANWLVRSECTVSNGTFGGIFETQTPKENTHTLLQGVRSGKQTRKWG